MEPWSGKIACINIKNGKSDDSLLHCFLEAVGGINPRIKMHSRQELR